MTVFIDSLIEFIQGYADVLAYAGIASIVLLVGTALLMPIFIAVLPSDYFLQNRTRRRATAHRLPLLSIALAALRNIVGVVLFIAGVIMLFVPGQGLLTILAALALIDFPKKHKLLAHLARNPRIMLGANRIRRIAGKAEFLQPDSAPPQKS